MEKATVQVVFFYEIKSLLFGMTLWGKWGILDPQIRDSAALTA